MLHDMAFSLVFYDWQFAQEREKSAKPKLRTSVFTQSPEGLCHARTVKINASYYLDMYLYFYIFNIDLAEDFYGQ